MLFSFDVQVIRCLLHKSAYKMRTYEPITKQTLTFAIINIMNIVNILKFDDEQR